MSFLDRLKHTLAKTRATIVSQFVAAGWDADHLERALIAADFGPRLAATIVDGVRKRLELQPRATSDDALNATRLEIEALLQDPPAKPEAPAKPPVPRVFLMVGVNGTGKTTTIAKLAHRFQMDGGKVLLAAADTFRAAAINQLKLWGERIGVEVVSAQYNADPASVAHDAIRRAQGDGFTHLLVDTAGRQHTKANLMQELLKVKRVLAKVMPHAPHETWLVVDAPTGGNALAQAREFHAALHLTGVIITKLDGTAKGGVVVAIRKETNLPIRFIGLGEGLEDLAPFDAKGFAEALVG
jgi:fused signal recognition particle receptor